MRLVVNHGTTLTFQQHHPALADEKKLLRLIMNGERIWKSPRDYSVSALVVTCRPLSLLLTAAHKVMHLIKVKFMLFSHVLMIAAYVQHVHRTCIRFEVNSALLPSDSPLSCGNTCCWLLLPY